MNELETLPHGTIVRRTIRGTVRYYHQWRESGKTKSRYLKPDEIQPLRELLARRKALACGASDMADAPHASLEEACVSIDELRRHLVATYGVDAFDTLYAIARLQILEEPLGDIRTTALEAAGLLRACKTETIGKGKAIEKSVLFTIPDLKRTLGRAAIDDLLDDDAFLHSSAQERKTARETLRATLEERILEEEVLNRFLSAAASGRSPHARRVKLLRFQGGGRAFVVADEEDLTCELYTVRNSDRREEEMLVDLADPRKLDAIEHRHGLITAREVLYLGRNAHHPTGVYFRNVAHVPEISAGVRAMRVA